MKPRMLILMVVVLLLSACAQVAKSESQDVAPASTETTPVETETTPVEAAPAPEVVENGSPKCIRDGEDTRLLIDIVREYCLQYPPEYDVIHGNESQFFLVKRSILNTSEPSVQIRLEPANGMTLEQAADQIAENYAIPGTPPIREQFVMDGEPAISLDGLSGQDSNRQVVVLHDGILFNLWFITFNESMPEAQAQYQVLYQTVISSFNFHPNTNICPDCEPIPETDPGSSQDDPGSASISGWLFNDRCDSGQDGEASPSTTPAGCVEETSPLGKYHADGVLANDEALIEGVVVSLGEGPCPSTGLAEATTIVTDLSYMFSSLKAGTYCVSIDPQREPNFSILRPGIWTYPAVAEGELGMTITVSPGEYVGMVNFGWDYQFQP